ncbi:hypothetical protein EDB80DRAFT_232016 [Ilyonectria destructans]|nr:hypothetical protein EDB80DRAFT_232016 [Ilyonectria destructans]
MGPVGALRLRTGPRCPSGIVLGRHGQGVIVLLRHSNIVADRFREPRPCTNLGRDISTPALFPPPQLHPLISILTTRVQNSPIPHLCTPVHRASLSPVLSLEATYRPSDTLAYGCPAPGILLDLQLDRFSCFSVSLSSHRLSSGARIRKRATDRYLQATHQRLSAHSQPSRWV